MAEEEKRQGEGRGFIAKINGQKANYFLFSLTERLLRGEAHNNHGVHGLGEVLRVALTSNRDGAPTEKAVLISSSQEQVRWGWE